MRPRQLRLWEASLPEASAAELIRAARQAHGVPQRVLADALGVDRATVSRLETGRLVPTIDDLAVIADALAVSVESLLGLTPARVRRHPRWAADRPLDRSAQLSRSVTPEREAEYVQLGGSLRALRAAQSGSQPLSAGQAAIAIIVTERS